MSLVADGEALPLGDSPCQANALVLVGELRADPFRAGISVLRLSRVDIHRSARRHHVSDDDIVHAYEHALTWVELGDDPPRYLVVGPDGSGNLLELVVLGVEEAELVIHAMPLRRSTERELFEGGG